MFVQVLGLVDKLKKMSDVVEEMLNPILNSWSINLAVNLKHVALSDVSL